MAWFTQGLIPNPSADLLLADTGPLAAGTISGTLLAYSTIACILTLHHRNATNTADLHNQKINLSTEGTSFRQITLGALTLALNERITITIDTGFVGGQIQCSLLG